VTSTDYTRRLLRRISHCDLRTAATVHGKHSDCDPSLVASPGPENPVQRFKALEYCALYEHCGYISLRTRVGRIAFSAARNSTELDRHFFGTHHPKFLDGFSSRDSRRLADCVDGLDAAGCRNITRGYHSDHHLPNWNFESQSHCCRLDRYFIPCRVRQIVARQLFHGVLLSNVDRKYIWGEFRWLPPWLTVKSWRVRSKSPNLLRGLWLAAFAASRITQSEPCLDACKFYIYAS
jgi:hypothetical protein